MSAPKMKLFSLPKTINILIYNLLERAKIIHLTSLVDIRLQNGEDNLTIDGFSWWLSFTEAQKIKTSTATIRLGEIKRAKITEACVFLIFLKRTLRISLWAIWCNLLEKMAIVRKFSVRHRYLIRSQYSQISTDICCAPAAPLTVPNSSTMANRSRHSLGWRAQTHSCLRKGQWPSA